MNENNHIDAKTGLFTTNGLEHVFNAGFMHNCYKDAEKWDCEAEVTPKSMEIIFEKYTFFKEKGYYLNGWTWKTLGGKDRGTKHINFRRQTPSEYGYYLSRDHRIQGKAQDSSDEKSDWNFLDVSADILTSIESNCKKYLEKDSSITWSPDYEQELKLQEWKNIKKKHIPIYKFIAVAGTIGNICPTPVGTNKGGGPPKKIETDSCFESTVSKIKNYWFKVFKDSKEYKKYYKEIEKKLEEKKTLGRYYKKRLYSYWINNELKISDKNDFWLFIKDDLFFCDYFTSDNFEVKNIDSYKNESEIDWFEATTKLIIERGYRIWYSGYGEDGIQFNDSRPFSQIQSEDSKPEDSGYWHVMRVKQVFDYLEHIVSNNIDSFSIKTPEQYIDDKSLNLV